jgi:hypothetical protein
MSNFSFTIFGPEDGYKQFTVPNQGLIPDDSFKINPSDFEFKSGGKLLQIIKNKEKIYISLHQQVFQVNGERPGYTFGESIYFETADFDVGLIVRNIYDLHAAFSHECITEVGRFDGFKFVNQYRSSQLSKFNILKNDFDSSSLNIKKSVESNFYPGAKSAVYITFSLDDLAEVCKIVSWMIDSIGSMKYSRLLIADNSSGVASDEFHKITSLDNESLSVFNSVYSAYVEYRGENSKLEKLKSELIAENNNLHSQNQDLALRLSNSMKQNASMAVQPSAKVVVSNANQNFNNIENGIELVKSDVSKLKIGSAKIQEDLSRATEEVSSIKSYSVLSVIINFLLVFVVGFIFYEINSLAIKSTNTDNSMQSLISEQSRQIRELKNSLSRPSQNTNEEGEGNFSTASGKSSSNKDNKINGKK